MQKRASAGNKKRQRRGFLVSSEIQYLAFFLPAADRADSVLSWVVNQGRSYKFLSAGSITQKM
jgi:hypothetical protein